MADLTNADLTNANLAGADLTDAVMNGAKLPGAALTGAKMTGASLYTVECGNARMSKVDLTNAAISEVNFAGADLTEAIFNQAVVRQIDIRDADLTGVQLSNPNLTNPTIDLTDAKINAKTNFTRAKMQYMDLRKHDLQQVIMAHADLTGSRLDHTKLNNAELSYADLTGATLTGGVSMYAANLSNATLTGADLTGAQMGSISLLFRVGAKAQFEAFQKALATGDGKTIKSIFADNGVTLSGSVIISASQYSAGRVWEVKTEQKTYTVRRESVDTAEYLDVYEPATAAILANAYMKDAVLTSANLYNVRAPGVQLYGRARLDGQAILERAQFDNANMGGINLKQAKLYGVNLDYATLTDAQFQGAYLTLDAGGGQTSLERANLQGADFSDAKLADAIFTDAAVAVARLENPSEVDGVWLFSAESDESVVKELQAGVHQFNLEPKLAADLKPGPAATSIRAVFKQNDIELSQQALVTVQSGDTCWTVTGGKVAYVIFKCCDQDQYEPALGVGQGTNLSPQFTIPLYLAKDLQNGPVGAAVRGAFKQNGVQLDSAARITQAQMITDWQIVDVDASYTVWLGLDETCELSIFVRPSLPNLIELFSSHSVPLTRRVTVASADPDRWMIDNDSNNPYNPVTNYIRFSVDHNRSDGTLDIYGAALRVRRLVAGDKLEYHNINCNVTRLTEKQLQSTTVCPNSLRAAANRNDNIPFRQWMRARELPKPPFCVPSEDGYFYCPSRDPRGTGPSGPSQDLRGS
jgi:uncharacterized protein YjbI with pentapeptide repeats